MIKKRHFKPVLAAFVGLCTSFLQSGCTYNTQRTLSKVTPLLHEISGITSLNGRSVWAHNDSGGAACLYEIMPTQQVILRTVCIDNAKNIDWEDLTHDPEGNIYIGDFGNNRNSRTDLCVYKIPPFGNDVRHCKAEKIAFRYADQTAFPPLKNNKKFDCEAFIYFKNSLYLFSKNHSKPYSGFTKMYKLPLNTPNAVLSPIDSFYTGSAPLFSFITAAALSPNQKTLALLSSNKIFLFWDFQGDDFLKAKKRTIPLATFSQKEAITFLDNESLLFADEKSLDVLGGNFYTLKVKNR